MAHAQKPDFVFRRNRRVHLNRRGRQFSRLLAAEVCASAVVILDTPCSEVMWSVLATHSIRQFPLHFPSRASQCTITFQLDSTPGMTGNSTSVPGYRKQLFLSVLNPTSCTFCRSLAVALSLRCCWNTHCRSLQCTAKTIQCEHSLTTQPSRRVPAVTAEGWCGPPKLRQQWQHSDPYCRFLEPLFLLYCLYGHKYLELKTHCLYRWFLLLPLASLHFCQRGIQCSNEAAWQRRGKYFWNKDPVMNLYRDFSLWLFKNVLKSRHSSFMHRIVVLCDKGMTRVLHTSSRAFVLFLFRSSRWKIL